MLDVAELDFQAYCRYYRAFEKYACLVTRPRDWPMETHVFFGATGSGILSSPSFLWFSAYDVVDSPC